MTGVPSQTQLRIAVVGAGRHAAHHVAAIGRCAGAAVVGIVDPAADAARALAESCSARAFGSLGECLAAGPVDVVHVVTPPSSHGRVAREALDGGAHVYVEKPFTETSREAGEVLDLAASRGLLVCSGHQLLFEPPSRELAERLPSVGRPAHVESYFAFRPVRRAPGGRAPLRSDLQLLDILPHPAYLLLDVLERAVPDAETELAALELSGAGTLHALVRRGGVTGVLTVTLEGRPVENFLRVVGRNGSVTAEYVRGTVQRLIGPGSSGPDKVAAPYRTAWQLGWGSTGALARRLLRRQRSYPGLAELFGAFYEAVRTGGPSPVSPGSILDTVRICERAAEALAASEERTLAALGTPRVLTGTGVVITGGTGFLGRELVRAVLARGRAVRVIARRLPAPWEREAGAEYVVADLGVPLEAGLLAGADTLIHAAAETAGGWADHERNSVAATEHVVRAAAEAGVSRVVQVSSVAVLARGRGPIGDDSPLEPEARGQGPYVWGKLESERRAVELGGELGLSVKVVRPGALVDYREFDPPGRLGKRLGPIFVAVGSPGHRLGTTDVRFCAEALAWMADHWEEAPERINLLDPEPPTKRELIRRLRADNPDLAVVWLPTVLLHPLSWLAIGLQKVLRPGQSAINAAKVFSVERLESATSARLLSRM
ncbi:MAG TPA: Gfo/Idh/MocA family oxidoreductase, partial [Gemmatimonadales bacterium]|nr:Gfo/Idh/MocA family oxidoreductase [Gemmatimonadales bacterium]